MLGGSLMSGHIRKRGNKWYYSFEVASLDGNRRRIERVGGNTKKEAEHALRKSLSDYEETGRVFEPSKASLADYMIFWLEEYVALNLSKNTYDNYKTTIDLHILPLLGNKRLSSLTPETLQKFINQKHRDGYARSTISIQHSILSNSLNQAVYPYKLIRDNPMQYVVIPRKKREKTTRKDLKVLSLEEIQEIIDFIGKVNSFYIPFMIGFYTGMRRGEVCGLKWDKVDLEKGTIEVDKAMSHKDDEGNWVLGPPKNNSSYRKFFMGDTLTQILKEHKLQQKKNKLRYGNHYKESNFVCTKENGEFVSPYSIKWSCSNIKNKLGIDMGFHSLRHTHATLLLERGAPIKDIQKKLGHARASITIDTYSHLTEKMQDETLDILNNLSSKLNF